MERERSRSPRGARFSGPQSSREIIQVATRQDMDRLQLWLRARLENVEDILELLEEKVNKLIDEIVDIKECME